MSRSQYEAEQDWLAEKAMLLDVHDNVVDIIQLYCMELLVILERYDKAAILQDGVLQPMQQGDYRRALDNLQDFVLNDISMFRLFPQLVDRAEPGLDILHKLAEEYELH